MLETHDSQGEFLENILNLVFYKNIRNNIIEKESETKYSIINGIITSHINNTHFVTQINISVNLSSGLLKFMFIYNKVENTFESYFFKNESFQRIRFYISDETKFLIIAKCNNLFLHKK